MTLHYKVLLRKEPEGGYTAIVPSLPGCISYGETIDHSIRMIREAASLYLESMKEHGETIPTEDETLEYTLTLNSHA